MLSKTFNSPMRTYVLLHTYFKSLLNGVQGGHACVELLRKYSRSTSMASNIVSHWADTDKTLVYLDGGVSLHMHDTLAKFESLGQRVQLPWACFFEDKATLEGMLTAIAVTLPESICKASNVDWEQATVEECGHVYDALVHLGMNAENQPAMLSIVQWIRDRPLAS